MDKWDDKFLEKVVNSYIAVLKKMLTKKENQWGIGLETELPYSKDIIRVAIALAYLAWDLDDDENRATLEASFLELESFISAEDYKVVKTFEAAFSFTEKIAKSGDIENAIENLANSPGSRAMEILENISTKKKERVKEILALRSILGLPSTEEFENIVPK